MVLVQQTGIKAKKCSYCNDHFVDCSNCLLSLNYSVFCESVMCHYLIYIRHSDTLNKDIAKILLSLVDLYQLQCTPLCDNCNKFLKHL